MEGRKALTAVGRILKLLVHIAANSRMLRNRSVPHVRKIRNIGVRMRRLTKPWRKATNNAATLDRRRNNRSGMTGYFASIASLRRKQTPIAMPKRIKQITLTLLQANITPPNSRPSSSVTVTPTMAILPSQSTALIPATSGVGGVSSLRNSASTMIAMPEQGTVSCQK